MWRKHVCLGGSQIGLLFCTLNLQAEMEPLFSLEYVSSIWWYQLLPPQIYVPLLLNKGEKILPYLLLLKYAR